MTGCGSSSSSEGSAAITPSDASADDATTLTCGSGLACGIVAAPHDGGDSEDAGATGPCGGHVCGTIALPQDSGDLDAADAGWPVSYGIDAGPPTDASDDATGPCHPVCGIIVAPDH